MNILILSTHFRTGGITSYILTLAKGLNSKNHNVYVATSGGNSVADLLTLGVEHLTLDIQTKSELNPKIYFALGKLRKLVSDKNIDVIHAQTRVTQVMAYFLSHLTGRPFVSTCHGFFKPKLSRKIFPCWGHLTIAISEAVKEHLLNDFGLIDQKIGLVSNGIDTNEFKIYNEKVKIALRREFGLSDGVFIGIIARLSDVKGHTHLIQAMRQVVQKMPEAHLLIVGEGPMEDTLKKMVDNLGLKKHIHFYPIVNRTSQILPLFDVFVMPSLQEGLGLSVMEAQAAGLPVIASRVGGLPSLIQDNETGLLVSVGDEDALAKAILTLLGNKGKAREMGQKARAFVEQEFSAENMVNRTIDCYERAVKIK